MKSRDEESAGNKDYDKDGGEIGCKIGCCKDGKDGKIGNSILKVPSSIKMIHTISNHRKELT